MSQARKDKTGVGVGASGNRSLLSPTPQTPETLRARETLAASRKSLIRASPRDTHCFPQIAHKAKKEKKKRREKSTNLKKEKLHCSTGATPTGIKTEEV